MILITSPTISFLRKDCVRFPLQLIATLGYASSHDVCCSGHLAGEQGRTASLPAVTNSPLLSLWNSPTTVATFDSLPAMAKHRSTEPTRHEQISFCSRIGYPQTEACFASSPHFEPALVAPIGPKGRRHQPDHDPCIRIRRLFAVLKRPRNGVACELLTSIASISPSCEGSVRCILWLFSKSHLSRLFRSSPAAVLGFLYLLHGI